MQTESDAILVDFVQIDEGFWKYNKKYNRVYFRISDKRTNNLEIQPIDWQLNDKNNYILGAILYLEEPTIKEISYSLLTLDGKERINQLEKDAFYFQIYRRIVKLFELDLISPASASQVGNFDKYSIVYKLSLRGLFYSLLNWSTNPFLSVGPKIILNKMLQTYSDSPLLRYFISSHFESHTLENADDDLSYELVEYLSEICKDIVVIKRGMAMSEDSLIGGMLPDYLFIWPSVNTERKYNYEKFFRRGGNLRQYLSREFGWNWISDAEIKPNFEDNIITIKDSPRGHLALIKIDTEKKTIVLIHGGKKILEFNIFWSGEKLVAAGKSTINELESSESLLRHLSRVKLFDLILSIRSEYRVKPNQLYKSLENDESFKKSIRDLISLIDLSN